MRQGEAISAIGPRTMVERNADTVSRHRVLGIHLLETPVLVFQGLHLANHRRIYYPAGDCIAICREGIPPYFDPICRTTRCSSRARGTAPTQAHRLRLGAGSKGFGVRYISSSSSKSPHAFLPRRIYFRIPIVFWGRITPRVLLLVLLPLLMPPQQ